MHKLYSKLKLGLGAAVCSFLLYGHHAQANLMPIVLEDSVWQQLVLPGIRGNTITVQQYFEEGTENTLTVSELAPANGATWALVEFDPFQGPSGGYVTLGATSLLKPGVGYWILQITGDQVEVSQPIGTTSIRSYPFDGCDDTTRNDDDLKDLCTLTYIHGERGPASVGVGSEWRLIGNPTSAELVFDDIAFGGLESVDGGRFVGPPGRNGFDFVAWLWDGTAYTALHSDGGNTIPTWAGFWIGLQNVLTTNSSFALLLPDRAPKQELACPSACTSILAPPGPPQAPDDVVIVKTGNTDSTTGNFIQSISVSDTEAGAFFTLTSGSDQNLDSPHRCEIFGQTTDNGQVVSTGQLFNETSPMMLNDAQFMGCVQEFLGRSNTDDLLPPLPTGAPLTN